jgi:hypothetical protein
MSLKKKIVVIALALGTILGFASGFHHLRGHGPCHGGAWSGPCERARP